MKLHPLAIVTAISGIIPAVYSATTTGGDHRTLFLNQEESAKKVIAVVDKANDSNVHGIAIPLGFVELSKDSTNPGNQQLVVAMGVPGVDEVQYLLVDTGSSTLAFCDSNIAKEAVNITKTNYAQCINYGVTLQCADDDSKSGTTAGGWVGPVYVGDVSVYDINTDEEVATVPADFVIMDTEVNYACDTPLNGIFGVAYSSDNNDAIEIPQSEAATFDASDLFVDVCPNPQVNTSMLSQCNPDNLTETSLPSVIEVALNDSVSFGYNSIEAFGLYVDYAATLQEDPIDAPSSSKMVPGIAAYFGGDLAVDNEYYNGGTPQVAQGSPDIDHFSVMLEGIRSPKLNLTTSFNASSWCTGHPYLCVFDSGADLIMLPLPEEDCETFVTQYGNSADELKGESLYIDLEGANGGTVTLDLPLFWLMEQLVEGKVACTDGNFFLGFPTFQYYYVVYNMGDRTLTFVDLQLSDAAEEFIEEGGGLLDSTTSSSFGLLKTAGLGMMMGVLLLFVV